MHNPFVFLHSNKVVFTFVQHEVLRQPDTKGVLASKFFGGVFWVKHTHTHIHTHVKIMNYKITQYGVVPVVPWCSN